MASQILQFFLLSFLPVFFTYVIERYLVGYFAKTEKRKNIVRNTFWLQPNFISYSRYPMGIITVLLFHFISPVFSIWFFSFWMITDITDGTIAKNYDLYTEKGEIIDPMSDKLLYFPPLFYISLQMELLNITFVIAFFVVDFIGQFSRAFFKEKAANLFGKSKTFMAVMVIAFTTCQQIYLGKQVLAIGNILLLVTCFLSFFSFFFRMVPNYWYANVLSLLNLLCGLIGIGLILFYNELVWALILVFIGQFLDLFDGRAAQKWGSTPRGEIFDDIADGTSFGIVIGLLVYYSIDEKLWAAIVAPIYFLFATYRLVRFLKDKKEAGSTAGVDTFNGLPTPAGALLTGGAVVYIPFMEKYYDKNHVISDFLLIGIPLITAFLMISRIPYIHFGRVILPRIPKYFKVILYTLILMVAIFIYKDQQLHHIAGVMFFLGVLYTVTCSGYVFGNKFLTK